MTLWKLLVWMVWKNPYHGADLYQCTVYFGDTTRPYDAVDLHERILCGQKSLVGLDMSFVQTQLDLIQGVINPNGPKIEREY